MNNKADLPALRGKRSVRMKKHKILYFLKQKLLGLVLVGFGILIPFVLDGDATVSVIIIPLGLFLIFTKQRVMEF